MSFIESMKEEAKKEIKTIVLPESEDLRTLEATQMVLEEGFANIVLIGNPDEINKLAKDHNIDLTGAQIVNPTTSAELSRYANDLYELRKNKGMTIEQAKERLTDIINTPKFCGMASYEDKKLVGFIMGKGEQYYDGIHFQIRLSIILVAK